MLGGHGTADRAQLAATSTRPAVIEAGWYDASSTVRSAARQNPHITPAQRDRFEAAERAAAARAATRAKKRAEQAALGVPPGVESHPVASTGAGPGVRTYPPATPEQKATLASLEVAMGMRGEPLTPAEAAAMRYLRAIAYGDDLEYEAARAEYTAHQPVPKPARARNPRRHLSDAARAEISHGMSTVAPGQTARITVEGRTFAVTHSATDQCYDIADGEQAVAEGRIDVRIPIDHPGAARAAVATYIAGRVAGKRVPVPQFDLLPERYAVRRAWQAATDGERRVLTAAAKAQNPRVREAAARSIATPLPDLERLTNDPDPEVARWASQSWWRAQATAA